jgi:hypothetical protein
LSEFPFSNCDFSPSHALGESEKSLAVRDFILFVTHILSKIQFKK